MIYQNKYELIFIDHVNGKPIEFPPPHNSLYKGYSFIRGQDNAVFFRSREKYINTEAYTKKESLIIENWDCGDRLGWLGIIKYGGRIGLVVEKDSLFTYNFYVLYDTSYLHEVGTTMQVDQGLIERLPLGFSFECIGQVRVS